MMLVNNPSGRKAYCAPTALSALTGRTVDAVEDVFLSFPSVVKRMKRSRRKDAARVRGVTLLEMMAAANELGCAVTYQSCAVSRYTLGQFAFSHRVEKGARYLVVVRGHVVALCDGYVVDTSNGGKPALALTCRSARCRVVCAIRIDART